MVASNRRLRRARSVSFSGGDTVSSIHLTIPTSLTIIDRSFIGREIRCRLDVHRCVPQLRNFPFASWFSRHPVRWKYRHRCTMGVSHCDGVWMEVVWTELCFLHLGVILTPLLITQLATTLILSLSSSMVDLLLEFALRQQTPTSLLLRGIRFASALVY